MSLKDFIGLKVKIKDDGVIKKGVVADVYLRGNSTQGGRQIERFAVVTEDGTLVFRDISEGYGVVLNDEEGTTRIMNKLLNIKKEDSEDLSREQLIDLED